MRAGTPLRLVLVGLAGVLALALVVGFLALRGPAPGARAADGDPTVIATVAVGNSPYGVAVNPNTNLIYVANIDNTVSVIDAPATRSSPPYRSGLTLWAWPSNPARTSST